MRPIVEFDALTDLENYMSAYPAATKEAARIALNDVSEDEGLATYRKAIESEVDFPDGYITTDRLGVRSRATNDRLAVEISGRQRATSLARFARAGQTVQSTRRKGVRVKVSKQGGGALMERAWLVNLRRGNADGGNIGLAIRLEPGERLRNKREVRSVQLDQNVFLLYGPSVDQVFRDVSVTETPPVLDKIGNEFFRQLFRIVGGKSRGR